MCSTIDGIAQQIGDAGEMVAGPVAENVHHDGVGEQARRRERQIADRAHVLLVLRARRHVDRVVAAVVRTRRDLVDEQLAAGRRKNSTQYVPTMPSPRPTIARHLVARFARSLRRPAPARSSSRGCRDRACSRRPDRRRSRRARCASRSTLSSHSNGTVARRSAPRRSRPRAPRCASSSDTACHWPLPS